MNRTLLTLTLLALASPVMADGITYGVVGDQHVILYTLDTGDLSLTTGTIGDNSVSILEYQRADDPLSIVTGNVGDDVISLWEYEENYLHEIDDTGTNLWYDDTQQ